MAYADPKDAAAYEAARKLTRKSSPSYLAFKERKKLVYEDRKARQVCVDCEAKLEEDDGLRCQRCDGRDKEAKRIYAHTRKGRATQRRVQRRYYRQRKKRDACVQCGLKRSEWPPRVYLKKPKRIPKKPKVCPTCRTKANEAAVRYRARKKAGITSLRSERAKRDREKLRELRGKTYKPLDELLAKPGVRIMRALERFDWIECDALFDAIGVPLYDEADHRERDTYTQTLSRLAREKRFIERRDQVRARRENIGLRMYEYRLTTTGRAELARLFGRKAS